jgi:pyruvate formate lyase activating enzyme
MTAWFAENLGASVPLHFTAFHPDYRLRDRPATPPSTLLAARDIARQAGLRFVYTGNVVSPETQSTRCPNCEQLLVGRDGYQITAWGLEEGRCAQCRLALPGHFDAHAGTWGPRRRRLDLAGAA